MKTKKKYWYRTDVEMCVLCGVEKKFKTRVYNEKERGIFLRDFACDIHFV